MSVTHTWKIKTLVQNNDDTGTVNQIYFSLHSIDGNYSYTIESDVRLDIDNIQNFISYDNLTEQIALQWVKDKLGSSVFDYEQSNTDWINQAKYIDENSVSPIIKVENLPWESELTP